MRVCSAVWVWLALACPAICMAQTVEYTKKLTGKLEISGSGRVSTYDIPSAGAPSIDQGLGSMVESWQFELPANTAVRAEFVITLVRKNMTDDQYTVKRVEFFPMGAIPKARRAQSAEELANCQKADATPRVDVICPAVLPADPDLLVSAEVYVAIRKTAGEPEISIESLNLYSNQNSKLLSKNTRVAKAKYSEAALAWAKKNSLAFLQEKALFLTRVEYVQSANTLMWRRQENVADAPTDWVNNDFRAKTTYVGQGGLEIKGQ